MIESKYLFELDSVRMKIQGAANSPDQPNCDNIALGKEILQKTLASGKRVVLSLNQIVDSYFMLDLMINSESQNAVIELFESGWMYVNLFGKHKSITDYILNSIDTNIYGATDKNKFIFSCLPVKTDEIGLLLIIRRAIASSNRYLFKQDKNSGTYPQLTGAINDTKKLYDNNSSFAPNFLNEVVENLNNLSEQLKNPDMHKLKNIDKYVNAMINLGVINYQSRNGTSALKLWDDTGVLKWLLRLKDRNLQERGLDIGEIYNILQAIDLLEKVYGSMGSSIDKNNRSNWIDILEKEHKTDASYNQAITLVNVAYNVVMKHSCEDKAGMIFVDETKWHEEFWEIYDTWEKYEKKVRNENERFKENDWNVLKNYLLKCILPHKQGLPYEPDWVKLSWTDAKKHREEEHMNTCAGIFGAILILAIISLKVDSIILTYQHDVAIDLFPCLTFWPDCSKSIVYGMAQIINFYFEAMVVWLAYKYIFSNIPLSRMILVQKMTISLMYLLKQRCFKIILGGIAMIYLIFPLFFRPVGFWEEFIAHIIRFGCLGIICFWYYTFKSEMRSNSKITEDSVPDVLALIDELAIYRREDNTIKAITKK